MSGGAFGLPGEAGGEVICKREEGRVLMAIRHNATGKVDWVNLAPEVALAIGQQLARDAYQALYNVDPPRSALQEAEIERKRQILIARLPIIMRQLHERKRPWVYIAEAVIDRVFAEIL